MQHNNYFLINHVQVYINCFESNQPRNLAVYWEQPKCPQQQRGKTHHGLVTLRIHLNTHCTARECVNCSYRNHMVNRRNQQKKSTDYMIPFMITSCSNQVELITVTGSQIVVTRGGEGFVIVTGRDVRGLLGAWKILNLLGAGYSSVLFTL